MPDIAQLIYRLTQEGAEAVQNALSGVQGVMRNTAISAGLYGAAITWRISKPLEGVYKNALMVATNLVEAQNKIQVIFGEGTSNIEKFARRAADNMGESTLSAENMAGVFGALFSNIGVNTTGVSFDIG